MIQIRCKDTNFLDIMKRIWAKLTKVPLFEPFQDKCVVIRSIAIDGVLWQGTCSPGVNTTHTMNIEVDVEVDELTTFYLMRMTGTFKVFLTVVPCTDAERLFANNG